MLNTKTFLFIFGLILMGYSCSNEAPQKKEPHSALLHKKTLMVETDTVKTKLTAKAPHPIYTLFQLDSLKDKEGEITQIDSISYPPYNVIYFTFTKGVKSDSTGWIPPYGAGWVLVENYENNPKLRGHYLTYGDLTAHTFHWLDFDQDGDFDVYTYSGEEEIFKTELLLNTTTGFTSVYTNHYAYCPLIDINADGKPEILSHDSAAFAGIHSELDLQLSKDQEKAIQTEYDNIVGDFNPYNYDYNLPDHYKLFSLNLTASTRILTIENDSIKDLSKNYPQYFCWRTGILNKIPPAETSLETDWKLWVAKNNSLFGCGL